MRHYLAVLIPRAENCWRVHFPDFPGCRAEGADVEMAIRASKREAGQVLRQIERAELPAPKPSSFSDVRENAALAVEHGIDWSTAIINLVDLEA